MFHKVKEMFQKLFPSNLVQHHEAPYKIEPKIQPLTDPVSQPKVKVETTLVELPQDTKVEETIRVVEKPHKIGTPRKPKINSNGTRSNSRKGK